MSKLSIKITIFFIVGLFLSVVVYHQFFRKDRGLKIESAINLEVIRIQKIKGYLVFNDSVAVSGNCPRILIDSMNYPKSIWDLTAPYKLLKEQESDTLRIIKDNDTIYYRLLNSYD